MQTPQLNPQFEIINFGHGKCYRTGFFTMHHSNKKGYPVLVTFFNENEACSLNISRKDAAYVLTHRFKNQAKSKNTRIVRISKVSTH